MNTEPISQRAPQEVALPETANARSSSAKTLSAGKRAALLSGADRSVPVGTDKLDSLEISSSVEREPLEDGVLAGRVEEANAHMQLVNQGLRFQVHEGTSQLLVQVVDRISGEVLRELPPHEFLDLVVRMREMVGAFLDETT
jgi:flagellar protein FlaG